MIEADKARRWGFVGRKRRGEAWPPGLYRGEAEILRRSPDGTLRRHISRQVTLK